MIVWQLEAELRYARCKSSPSYAAGTLPPEWSAFNLNVLALDRNSLSGAASGASSVTYQAMRAPHEAYCIE